jgi:hypothetical protein
MTSPIDRDLNPYRSPSDGARAAAAECVVKRLSPFAWAAVILPPLAMLAALGLAAYIDSLTLGPRGFFFVILLMGPGAWAIALASAAVVVTFLSRGAILAKALLWIIEIALCIVVYCQVLPLLGGWS